MFLLRAVLNTLVRNASFRCLIFNLSGHCELVFLLCFIATWTSGLAKFDWKVVSHWATKYNNLVVQQ